MLDGDAFRVGDDSWGGSSSTWKLTRKLVGERGTLVSTSEHFLPWSAPARILESSRVCPRHNEYENLPAGIVPRQMPEASGKARRAAQCEQSELNCRSITSVTFCAFSRYIFIL